MRDHVVDVNDIEEGDILQPNDDELDHYALEQIASLEYHDVTPEELEEYLHRTHHCKSHKTYS
jgi:hypothetical protein